MCVRMCVRTCKDTYVTNSRLCIGDHRKIVFPSLHFSECSKSFATSRHKLIITKVGQNKIIKILSVLEKEKQLTSLKLLLWESPQQVWDYCIRSLLLYNKLPMDVVAWNNNTHLSSQKMSVVKILRASWWVALAKVIQDAAVVRPSCSRLEAWPVPAVNASQFLVTWAPPQGCCVSPWHAVWLLSARVLQKGARQKPHSLLWLSLRGHMHPFCNILLSHRRQLTIPHGGAQIRVWIQEDKDHSGGWLPYLCVWRVSLNCEPSICPSLPQGTARQ